MIVVKIGGSVVCKDPTKVVENLPNYADKAVVVHGGGCLVNDLLKRMGVEPKFLTHPGGLVSRYTDLETLKVFVMAMSWINKSIVASLHALGVEALGLTGADLGVVKARRKEKVLVVDERGRQRVVDGGYVGRVVDIAVDKLRPPPLKVLSPVAVSERGELLNIDGDQLAFDVAKRLGAERLVLLSDVDGLIIGGSVVPRLTAAQAEELVKNEEVRGGMKRKLLMAAEAAKLGLEVVISNGLVDKPIDAALSGRGTHVVKG
ncbi:[LysW]-aminoadipate/[LysW]-glutamate kinase [Pyrobaculum neutrophilum]|uniref:Putative [LysW]-aminoadipate/[LysW]-glutamate kinase n=1 Tax=Pyrobaculum neutrophilum (strain DSM 2338 / JCM 9278 / NBRC 100436 / V24Sta) TaxID=444157 RepID=LYSZ_PYRNV|nr:[LysW]-aminoadipate/[LysW]-glutamate kinase [Pyrobaculum neutrophilum]B1YB53.1 RecName: Full=Putative [LysW]-aminoadipate/[LysW]-glutamate kinase [Pyrobaculum neutrophilum V24Sta]ACB40753.1 acetylglutamate kinase [Pyrobaculum neutrophilum V24Sta]